VASQTFTGTNTYSGTTTVTEGTLQLGNNGSTGSVSTGDVILGNAGTLAFNRSDNFTFSNKILGQSAGNGAVLKSNSNILTLSGANTYGTTQINAGVLYTSGNASAFGTGLVTVASGAQAYINDTTVANSFNITGGGTTFGGTNLGAIRLQQNAGTSTGVSGQITLNGAATIGAQLYSGGGNIAGGVFTLGAIVGTGPLTYQSIFNPQTFSVSGAGSYSGNTTVQGSSTLKFTGAGTPGASTGNINLASANDILEFAGNSLTAGNQITGLGRIIHSSSNTTTLTGANDYSGTTTISGGTLQVGAGGTSGTLGSGAASIALGSNLSFFRSNALTVGNAISGAGALNFLGTGVQDQSDYSLGASSAISGTIHVSSSRLQVSNSNQTGTAAITVNSGAGLVYSSNASTLTNALSLAGNGWNETSGYLGALRIRNGSNVGSAITLTANTRIGAHNDSGTVSGVISGAFNLEFNTPAGATNSTVYLTNTSNYTGSTTVNIGTLSVGNGGATGTLGATTGVSLAGASTLAFNKNVNTTIDKSVSGNGNVTANITGDLALTSTMALTGTNTINLTASGAITETSGSLAATNLYLTATNGGIGAVGNRIQSDVSTLYVSAGGHVFVTEANAVTVAGRTTAGNGNIDVTTTNGTLTVNTVNSVGGITAHGTGNITLTGNAPTGHGISITNNITATNGDVSLTGTTASTANPNAGVYSQSTVAAKNITMVATATGTTNAVLGYYGAGGVFNASQQLSLTGTSNSGANGLYSYTGSYLSGTGMTLVGSSRAGQGLGFDAGVTVTNTTSGGISVTGTATDSTKQAIGMQGLAITNGGGNVSITASNGHIFSGVGNPLWGGVQTNTIVNNGTGDVQVVAGNGSATNSGSINGSVFTITQNGNSGVVVSTSGTGNVTSPKIINAGTGDIVVAAGSLIAAGTETGGQILTVAGNTLAQNNGTPGKTYVYSGAPSTTGVLSNLNAGFNNLYYQGTSAALNAGFNQGFDANHANDMLVPGGGSASGTQVFFRTATKPSFSMTLNNTSKQYGDVADPALTATAATLTNAVAGVGGNNTFGVASADVIAGMTGTRAPGSALGTYEYSLNASAFNTTLTEQPRLVIGKRDITLAAVVASNKTYDGFTTATITSGTFNNLVAGEALLISGSGTFNTKDVADNKLVTVADVSTLTKANGVGGNWNNYNLTTTNITTLANITKATLNVTANADAKFVTQADTANFNGVSYGPFLGTDTAVAEVNAAGLTVTRTNNTNNGQGSYAGVLVASGLASTNYDFNYITGNYTIVPAGRLLVSTTNQTVAYGASPTYATTASYLDNDGVTINTLTRTGTNNNYTFNDGVGTTISFVLKPYTGANVATQSSSNKTVPGTYDVKDALYVRNGNNFTGTPVFVGNLTVTKSSATVTANGATLTYNGANQTATGFSATGLAAGETASVLTGVTASTTQLNAGTYTTTATGTDSNYNLTFVNGVMNIGKAALTATANSASVTFNGGAQSVTGFTVAGLLGADTVGGLTGISASGATGTNVGAYASTMTVADQPNYTVTGVNGALTINAAPVIPQITGSLTGSVSKVYDGTNIATLTPANYVLMGWVGADSATISKTSGTYDSATAGTNKTVTVSLSGGDFVAGAGTNLANYELPTSVSGAVGSIGKANLTATANSSSVVYNGANQSVFGFSVTGLRGSDTVGSLMGISASGATGTNVGTYANTMTVANQTNYTVMGVNGALTIGAAQLTGTLTGSVSKVYDGTTVATLTPANYTLTGWLGSDGAVVTKTLGSYNNANVGVDKTVTVSLNRSDYQASGGADLSNYNLPTSLTGLEGVITPKNVSLNSFVVANKVYDGNNVATITSGSVLTGVGSETLSVRGTGSFVDKNAGDAKLVKPADVSALTQLDGSASWLNYKLVNSNVTSTASITPKLIQASGSVGDKVYDGTVAATVNGMAAVGLLTGDTVYLQAGSADFADKDVSRDAAGNIAPKVVTVSRLSLAGVDAQNYLLDRNMFTAQAKITPRPLQLSAQALNKVYDTTPLATIKLGGLIGLVGAEQLQVMAAGAFENAEIGTNKLVNVRFDLGNGPNGGFAENYSLIPQTLRASITNQSAIPPLQTSAVPSAVKPATSAVTFAVKTATSDVTFSGAALAAVGERVLVQPSVVSCDLDNLEDCDCEPSKLDNVLICYVPREATSIGRMLPGNTGALKK
jgi:hypothetical protein